MAVDPQIQLEFQSFLADLVSVEKKVIHALTDVARDILRSRPHGAATVAAVITSRVLQVRGRAGGRAGGEAAPRACLPA